MHAVPGASSASHIDGRRHCLLALAPSRAPDVGAKHDFDDGRQEEPPTGTPPMPPKIFTTAENVRAGTFNGHNATHSPAAVASTWPLGQAQSADLLPTTSSGLHSAVRAPASCRPPPRPDAQGRQASDHSYFTQSLCRFVLQKPVPAEIYLLILYDY